MPQSLANLLLHIVFSTKGHFPFISPEMEKELYPYLVTMAKDLGCPIKIINGTEDHIHIFCSLSRTITVADLIGKLKHHSSKMIKVKGREWTKFGWQNGYGAFSIGHPNQQELITYIRNQKEHHKTVSWEDEFRKFLTVYQIPYDERYVWD